ncbi:nicotinate phosphoribosyltransferase [Rhodoflexus caldus]|uniref:nicotinate phosphoribosyltransferase n=1 Tax=Rhodoflexus caldus TaxID=2891236 RepID=UPI00202A3E63|nr:nicotinate phosphoribosyltransferase [Rhodoflexus caldus]
MKNLQNKIYNGSLTLLTDLYQITMAYGYWKSQMTEREAVFNLFFRKNPFNGGYTIAGGLSYAIDFLENFHFDDSDIAYLATLTGADGKPLFEQGFLDYLAQMHFTCDVDAIPEGTVVFPQEPLLRIKGPLIQGQLVETALLNIINFQSLIATKAARVCQAANGEPVLEFGLRRAQGIDGGLAASRAAYIGGCTATSNVLAGKLFDIPVRGTHAHSWVMSFPDEKTAFNAYAKAMPNNCVFLVDTYDTLEGVKHAIEVGKELKAQGYHLAGIRLDSGDLAYLSIKARQMLDDAGFIDTNIVASNDLDENIVTSLKQQEAKVNVWGIGTKLVTAFDQPALGGVYKITAIKNEHGQWDYKLKLSEQAIKISNPGLLQVQRFYDDDGLCAADMIYDEESFHPEQQQQATIVDPLDLTRRKIVHVESKHLLLLKPIFKNGRKCYESPDIHSIRAYAKQQLETLHPTIRRFTNPHQYPVGLEKGLYELKTNLILKLRHLA